MVTRRVLAIGGGFMMEGQRLPIDEQIVALAGQNFPGRESCYWNCAETGGAGGLSDCFLRHVGHSAV